LEWQKAKVGAGEAGWSLDRIEQQRQERLASPEYQREIENARNAWKEQQAGKTTAAVDQFSEFANQQGEKLANVHGKQSDIDQYYSQMDAPIQSQFYQAGDQVAAQLARNGLGGSGINVAGSAMLSNNKSALEKQAMGQSTIMAQQKERQGLLDEFTTKSNAMQTELQNKGIDISSATATAIARMQTDAQLQMMREQMNAANQAGVGKLVGEGVDTAATVATIMAMCDRRLKTNIVETDREWLPGLKVYEFEYTFAPGIKRYGPMAQEVEKLYPELVDDALGIKRVRLTARH
jgi:hypothetical protein